MTPGARLAEAATLLDAILAGAPAEQVLTRWARSARYAGSGDRAAVRDIVFDVLRRRRSAACRGGAETGRALVLGLMAEAGIAFEQMVGQGPHDLAPLDPDERAHLARPPEMPELVALDCPDWLAPELRASLGGDFAAVMGLLRQRAPVFLRANLLKTDRAAAAEALATEGIATRPHPLASTALEVVSGARRLRNSAAFRDGLVEPQDAASQAVAERLLMPGSGEILDYCAGGGGKALALAARRPGTGILVHDADPRRMADLPGRAARAGAALVPARENDLMPGRFGLVLCDVPCSGSGAWRRSPEGKWALTPQRLRELAGIQQSILGEAAALVASGGVLAYATCSLLATENDHALHGFLDVRTEWTCVDRLCLTPLDGGDGFFLAQLRRV